MREGKRRRGKAGGKRVRMEGRRNKRLREKSEIRTGIT